MTFEDAACKRHKPQNKKATQNKPSQNANNKCCSSFKKKLFNSSSLPLLFSRALRHKQLKLK
jgi:hypothetical protein